MLTFADYSAIEAMLFYDLHDLREAEIERQNREAKKQSAGRAKRR